MTLSDLHSWIDAAAAALVVAIALVVVVRRMRAPACASCPSGTATDITRADRDATSGRHVALSRLSIGRGARR